MVFTEDMSFEYGFGAGIGGVGELIQKGSEIEVSYITYDGGNEVKTIMSIEEINGKEYIIMNLEDGLNSDGYDVYWIKK